MFTGNGDKGSSTLFGSRVQIPKSDIIFDALGTVDELNALLGLCKVRSAALATMINDKNLVEIVHYLQEQLFTIQAELGGSNYCINGATITLLESLIVYIEDQLPPITTFFIAGGTELAALFDVARTVARRAERTVIAVSVQHVELQLSEHTKVFLNRLSTILYALSRWVNHMAGVAEQAPHYEQQQKKNQAPLRSHSELRRVK